MPNRVEPMLATLAAGLPANAGDYAFEFKWDGVRALSFFERSRMRLLSRNLLDITARYPELHAMVAVFGDRSAILDGEIVALDENDRTSFSLLQRRMHANPHAALRLVHEIPVYYVLFDVLYLDGHSTVRLPYLRRREMLEELTLAGPSWRVCPSMVGDGGPMWETARKHAMEGIVAKRLDSVYEPGRRSPAWLKIKLVQRQEFVVGGWRTERGSSRSLGALLIGYHDAKDGKLHYAGSLGTGFNGRTLAEMEALLLKREVGRNPFAETVPGSSRGSRDVHYVRPDLVVEAEFRRWPKEGLVQQASFKGLRTDKRARDVVREEPEWT
jgi:bifunctional non-homologous end joining protein LigD